MLNMFMKKSNKKGFTLVELMVVVAIIGILVAIAVPIYNASRTSAQENSCRANLRTINGAVSMYLADGGDESALTSVSDLVPDYLQSVPKCPQDTTKNYTIDSNTKTAVCPNGHSLP